MVLHHLGADVADRCEVAMEPFENAREEVRVCCSLLCFCMVAKTCVARAYSQRPALSSQGRLSCTIVITILFLYQFLSALSIPLVITH